MKNTFGTSIALTLFVESHGKAIGAVLDGMPAGIPVDPDFIAKQLDLRRPYGKISTGRVEADRFEIVSGVFEGRTTGTPLCILIPNEDTRSGDYTLLRSVARPGPADYTAFVKYHGYEDYRGGGHFSGRVTAALTAAGAIAIAALQSKGIRIGTHIARCAGICDRSFEELEKDLTQLNGKLFAVLDEKAETDMQEAIRKAAEEGDSVGGILETVVTGMPAGIGEPWFDTMEGCLAQGLFSIPGINGVRRFPVALAEAAFNLILFIVLWRLSKNEKTKGRMTILYCLSYPVARFILEFFRGDGIRGFLWGLSTSQWISIVIFAAALTVLIVKTINRPKDGTNKTVVITESEESHD